jgi:thiol-disulfide isomerase/thioredoxin
MKAAILAILALSIGVVAQAAPLPDEGRMPSLEGSQGWVNTGPLDTTRLRGKVVLVNFWTFTCINWIRTLPYLRGWSAKYSDQGLVVLGVHSPEFDFEQEFPRVAGATQRLGISYPILVDSKHEVWRSFRNQYWPATYLVDAKGRVRLHHFGEGHYEEIERAIQQLLREAGATSVSSELLKPAFTGAEVVADSNTLGSPENYLGFDRTVGFVSPGGLRRNRSAAYEAPRRIVVNEWGLVGGWSAGRQAVTLDRAPGRLIYRFHSRDLNLVMGSTTPGTPVRFRITIDGAAPGNNHGADTDAHGIGTVSEHRLYQLLRQAPPIKDRLFEIEFLDAGLEAFAATFG